MVDGGGGGGVVVMIVMWVCVWYEEMEKKGPLPRLAPFRIELTPPLTLSSWKKTSETMVLIQALNNFVRKFVSGLVIVFPKDVKLSSFYARIVGLIDADPATEAVYNKYRRDFTRHLKRLQAHDDTLMADGSFPMFVHMNLSSLWPRVKATNRPKIWNHIDQVTRVFNTVTATGSQRRKFEDKANLIVDKLKSSGLYQPDRKMDELEMADHAIEELMGGDLIQTLQELVNPDDPSNIALIMRCMNVNPDDFLNKEDSAMMKAELDKLRLADEADDDAAGTTTTTTTTASPSSSSSSSGKAAEAASSSSTSSSSATSIPSASSSSSSSSSSDAHAAVSDMINSIVSGFKTSADAASSSSSSPGGGGGGDGGGDGGVGGDDDDDPVKQQAASAAMIQKMFAQLQGQMMFPVGGGGGAGGVQMPNAQLIQAMTSKFTSRLASGMISSANKASVSASSSKSAVDSPHVAGDDVRIQVVATSDEDDAYGGGGGGDDTMGLD